VKCEQVRIFVSYYSILRLCINYSGHLALNEASDYVQLTKKDDDWRVPIYFTLPSRNLLQKKLRKLRNFSKDNQF
jgi:hypothetical protein